MARKRSSHRIRSFYTHDEERLARLKSGRHLDGNKGSPEDRGTQIINEETVLYHAVEGLLGEPLKVEGLVCMGLRDSPNAHECEYWKTGVDMIGLLDRVGGSKEGICIGKCAYQICEKE